MKHLMRKIQIVLWKVKKFRFVRKCWELCSRYENKMRIKNVALCRGNVCDVTRSHKGTVLYKMPQDEMRP